MYSIHGKTAFLILSILSIHAYGGQSLLKYKFLYDKFKIACEYFEHWFVFLEAADTGLSKVSNSANPNSKDRHPADAGQLPCVRIFPFLLQAMRVYRIEKKTKPQSCSFISKFSAIHSIG